MNLNVDVNRVDNVMVVDLAGELDAYTSPDLRESVVRLIETESHDIVINLAQVEFIDSVGLGTLVGCLKRAAEHGGSITLASAKPQVRKVFDITGLSKIFAIYQTREEAIERITPTASGGS